MNKSIFSRIASIAMALMLLFSMAAANAEVEKLVINQIVQSGNDVNLYVSAMDGSGAVSADALSADSFAVSMNGETMNPDSIQRFSDTGEGIAYSFCVDISGSVTSKEEQQIREALSQFIGSMGANDYARVITIGEQITVACDFTQDRQALSDSLSSINNGDNKTYLYEGISYALDSIRKTVVGMPTRSVIMVFTDGMDDSDGTVGEDELMLNSAMSRIPIYITALKGNDKSADLSLISRISRNSGGVVYSYSDYSIVEAIEKFHSDMNGAYVLHTEPEYDYFGQSNINWKVILSQPNYSVSSATYVYSLSMDNVVDNRIVETAAPVITAEPTATVQAATLPPLDMTPVETAAPETPQPTEIIAGQDASEDESEGEEITIIEWAMQMAKDYLHIVIAGLLVLLAIIIIIIALVAGKKKRRKKQKKAEEEDFTEYEEEPVLSEDEKTFCDENEGEHDAFGDETFVEENPTGPLVELEITTEGQTIIREVIIADEIRLERSETSKQQCRMSFNDKHISRKHAVLFNRVDGIYVRDEGSSRGSFLNGVEVKQEMPIHNGDVLRLGDGGTTIRINILRP